MYREDITGLRISLEGVMRPAVSVRRDTRAGDALKVMLDNGVPGVPVENERGHLVGFVSEAHLLASTLPSFVTFANNLPRSPKGESCPVYRLIRKVDNRAREAYTAG